MSHCVTRINLLVFILPYNRDSNETLLSGNRFSRTDSAIKDKREGQCSFGRSQNLKSKGCQHLLERTPTIIEYLFICSKTAWRTALWQFGGKLTELHIDYLFTLIFHLLPVPPQVSSHPQKRDQHPVGKRGYAPCWRWSSVSFLWISTYM